MSAADRHATAGSALIEALVALVLIAIAGLVVASASVVGLRATRRAATLEHTAALAARELAALTTRAASAESGDAVLVVPGLIGPVQRAADVRRDGAVASLSVRITAGRPAESVTLATRTLVDE